MKKQKFELFFITQMHINKETVDKGRFLRKKTHPTTVALKLNMIMY